MYNVQLKICLKYKNVQWNRQIYLYAFDTTDTYV